MVQPKLEVILQGHKTTAKLNLLSFQGIKPKQQMYLAEMSIIKIL